jgi:hypothetical protein
MDERSKAIFRASGVLDAASVLRMYANDRRERGQISAKTAREFERAVDALKDRAVAIRDASN